MKIEFEKGEITKALRACINEDDHCDGCPFEQFTNCRRNLLRNVLELLEEYERGEALEEARRKMEEENLTDEELFGE